MDREKIKSALMKIKKDPVKYRITRIGYFGSYARGENNKNSDVDVVVEQYDPDLMLLSEVRLSLQEELGVKVDIVRLREKMNPYLKKRIENEAVFI